LKPRTASEQARDILSFVAFTPKGGCPLKLHYTSCTVCTNHNSSIHPQGWVPIETQTVRRARMETRDRVAFTPKGGCPLKLDPPFGWVCIGIKTSSIHPQGWVPIETRFQGRVIRRQTHVAFTPKGGCPLKLLTQRSLTVSDELVAFTPKGGCPLKQHEQPQLERGKIRRSIHPQGWVPIETRG